MRKKGVESFKRKFVCGAFSIAFFRIPEFREVFLKQIEYKSTYKKTHLLRKLTSLDKQIIDDDPSRLLNISDLVDLESK